MAKTPANSGPDGGAPPPKTAIYDNDSILSPEEQRAVFAALRLERCGIPRRFMDKTLENFVTRGSKERRDVVQAARSYLSSFGAHEGKDERPGVLLSGGTGTGKTHILVAILRELMAKGHSARYYNVPNLLKLLRATYDGQEDLDEDDLINEMCQVEVLALDDLGAEKPSDWTADRLYLIVNTRYEECRPVLVATNLAWPEDLERAIGRRIASRLAEMCSLIGPFPSQDWRYSSVGIQRRTT
ncbi:MAG: DNA replication protein DnaC [candidate division BRC1 bacterium ADurb.BinA364]|nr:MAG: DNA replication protein DnaC [candidate division BRC1 bacterium ADurb.BinA364]